MVTGQRQRLDRRALLPPRTRVELGLLLECCYVRAQRGSELQRAKSSRISTLAEGVASWHHVLRLARWFRLSGFVERDVDLWFDAAAPKLSDETFRQLENASEQRRVRFAMLFDEALQLVERLGESGIDSILLKGCAFTHRLYGDGALRPMSDIDVLIREPQIEEATRLLLDQGYTTLDGSGAYDGSSGDRHAPRLISSDALVEVELHRHIIHPRSPLAFPVEQLWEGRRTSKAGTTRIPVLSVFDEILHMATAFFLDRHRYYASHGSLMQLVDLRQLVLQSDATYGALEDFALVRGLDGVLRFGLASAESLLGPLGDASPDLTPIEQQELARFLKRRALDSHACFFHELVELDDLGFNHEARSIARRAWPDRGYLAKKFAAGSSRSVASQRLAQLRELGRVLSRPRRMIDELATERWMRAVEAGG